MAAPSAESKADYRRRELRYKLTACAIFLLSLTAVPVLIAFALKAFQ